MKTLKNHLILFDADCALCTLYTRQFVKLGMLEKEGRLSYQEFPDAACPMFDRQRAVDEIALINRETGEVTYGVKSLFKVFGTVIPTLKPLFEYSPFVWVMDKAYSFISYNRRVIMPADTVNSSVLQPGFSLGYRIAYLVFTWFVTAFILSAYAKLMTGLLPQGPAYREYLICGGQILFQGVVISFINKQRRWDYLGNMMTISFIGAMLLLPGLIAAVWIKADPIINVLWFMGVAGFMLLLHLKRTKLLGLGFILTLSWVFYRLLVLLLIFL